MTVKTFFRNPDLMVRELVELGVSDIAWDWGYIQRRRIDPDKFGRLWFPRQNWQALCISVEGTTHIDQDHDVEHPLAVYPTWSAEMDGSLVTLEEMLAYPIGEDEEACKNNFRNPGFLGDKASKVPVFGQPHVVVVTDLPDSRLGLGRKLLRELRELQIEYPAVELHIHGIYSFRILFGLDFKSVDWDARFDASKGKVVLPVGKPVMHEQTVKTPNWVTLLGYSPVDLGVPRNRCMYNVKSALWAAKHFTENVKVPFGKKMATIEDAKLPDDKFKPLTVGGAVVSKKATVGDKFHCDTCSLQNHCKYFRSGAVCSVPDSEPSNLARMFGSRDSETIITGLGTLLQAQSHRLERGMEDEETVGEIDPNVTAIAHGLFTNGVKLAKLLNPALDQPKVSVSVGVSAGNAGTVAGGNAKGLVAAMVAELESRGIPRDKITPEMIENLLKAPDKPQAIEGVVLAEKD